MEREQIERIHTHCDWCRKPLDDDHITEHCYELLQKERAENRKRRGGWKLAGRR